MLNDEHVAALEGLGWDFVPTGPNEFEWVKFSRDGELVVARQGDKTWARDLDRVGA